MFERWIQALEKLDYVRKIDRPNVECILCSVRDDDMNVKNLKIYQDDVAFICLNLFPYNPGHLLIVPNRHIKSFRELDKSEALHITRLIQGVENLMEDVLNSKGFNIGINEGPNSGASIDHLHYHLVPRYPNELGFIDITSETRVVIEGLESIMKRLKERIGDHINNDFFMKYE
jgi:ATP adenylyltransferase